jgi:hypothetical protein
MKKVKVLCMLLSAALLLGACAAQSETAALKKRIRAGIEQLKPPETETTLEVSHKIYHELKRGMTMDEATRLIGDQGIRVSVIGEGTDAVVVRAKWSAGNNGPLEGAYIVCTFENDALTAKTIQDDSSLKIAHLIYTNSSLVTRSMFQRAFPKADTDDYDEFINALSVAQNRYLIHKGGILGRLKNGEFVIANSADINLSSKLMYNVDSLYWWEYDEKTKKATPAEAEGWREVKEAIYDSLDSL